MQPLSAQDVLDVWERDPGRSRVERSFALLAAARPEASPAQLAALSIGEFEIALMTLHQLMFGDRMRGFATCPACGEALQLAVSIAELRASLAAAAPETGVFAYRDYEVEFRRLSGGDLAAAARCDELDSARALLVRRAVLTATRRGKVVASDRLPATVLDRLAEQLADRDPAAGTTLGLTCSECAHQWPVELDVGVFLWSELRTRAQRLVRDVHTLASAYGWREADILSMSSRRREVYLEMVGA